MYGICLRRMVYVWSCVEGVLHLNYKTQLSSHHFLITFLSNKQEYPSIQYVVISSEGKQKTDS